MAKDTFRFRTYGCEERTEFSRKGRDRKVEVRHCRIEAIYTKQNIAADIAASNTRS
jgi:hypothetical protein